MELPKRGPSSSLRVRSRAAPVILDATNLTAVDFMIISYGVFPTTSQVSAYFLPGNRRFRSTDIDFDFQILPTGVVDYDPALDAQLTGRGTSTLTILP
jgi:hypothetical protein